MFDFPRIKDLPEHEQEPFEYWLHGLTMPWNDDLPLDEQDGYYPWDYDRWKKKIAGD